MTYLQMADTQQRAPIDQIVFPRINPIAIAEGFTLQPQGTDVGASPLAAELNTDGPLQEGSSEIRFHS